MTFATAHREAEKEAAKTGKPQAVIKYICGAHSGNHDSVKLFCSPSELKQKHFKIVAVVFSPQEELC